MNWKCFFLGHELGPTKVVPNGFLWDCSVSCERCGEKVWSHVALDGSGSWAKTPEQIGGAKP